MYLCSVKVLFLSEWYPNRYDAMTGLFVKKHAEALANQGVEVCVLYLHNDSNVDDIDIVLQSENSFLEICVYYRNSFISALKSGYKVLRKEFGLPNICQLNVISKNGILAEYLYRRYHIPYVIVEHWSGYLPQNYSLPAGFKLKLMQKFAADAKCILPVSQILEDAMKANGFINRNYQRIYNVVDDFFFEDFDRNSIATEYTKDGTKIKQILHVSCFDERAKNVMGILRAIKKLSEIRLDFHLTLVGTGQDFDKVKSYASELSIPASLLTFTGELTPHEVCSYMQKSDFFLLFSNYENAPVVLSECMAVGLPILSSNAGGIPEMITDEIGILTPVANDCQLAENLIYMLDHYMDFDTDFIRSKGKLYSYSAVAMNMLSLYNEILHFNK